MSVGGPNFSPFPFERLPRRSRADAGVESALARWVAGRRTLPSVAKLVGGPTVVTSVGITRGFDPYAAFAEVRVGPLAIVVGASGRAIRVITQRLLGGPAELAAPRPATAAEHAIWVLLLAAALDDLDIGGDAWPLGDVARTALERDLVDRARPTSNLIGRRGLIAEAPAEVVSDDAANLRGATVAGSRRRAGPREDELDDRKTTQRPATRLPVEPEPTVPASSSEARIVDGRDFVPIELALDAAGTPLVVTAWCPAEVVFRVPPPRPVHRWTFELPIVVARCTLDRAAVAALAVRDVVIVERDLCLMIGDGAIGLSAAPEAVEANVATGYVRRDMGPEAQLELTVRLGTTKLALRRIGELAVGEVIAFGRPLAGPYEIFVAGRRIGEGELVDIDGEVGVRIVSLVEE